MLLSCYVATTLTFHLVSSYILQKVCLCGRCSRCELTSCASCSRASVWPLFGKLWLWGGPVSVLSGTDWRFSVEQGLCETKCLPHRGSHYRHWCEVRLFFSSIHQICGIWLKNVYKLDEEIFNNTFRLFLKNKNSLIYVNFIHLHHILYTVYGIFLCAFDSIKFNVMELF